MPLLPKIPSSPGMPPEAQGPILPSGTPKMPSGSPAIIPNVSSASIRFTETADYEKGFTEYFDEKIKPAIKELEQERLMKLVEVEKLKPKANIVMVVGILIGIAITFYSGQLGWAIFLIVVAVSIRSVILNGPKAAIAGKYKEKIVPLIVKFFGNFNYSQDANPPQDMLRASGLFDDFNQITADDCIDGNHKGTNFSFSELDLERSSGKHSTTVFSGIMILMDIKKAFAGQTVIRRESQKGLWASMTGKFKGMQKVPFGNPEFEKLFEVYSSDPNEATMLVTPDFIAKLMELDNRYPNGMRCGFNNGKLLLAVNYGGKKTPGNVNIAGMALGLSGGYGPGQLFETGSVDKSLTDVEDIHKFLGQMNAILQIIETVNPPKAEL